MAALGITFEGPKQEHASAGPSEIDVEPENWKVVAVFNSMRTQWRTVSLSGAKASIVRRTGLDHSVLPIHASAHAAVVDEDFIGAFGVLEGAAIRQMDAQAERQLSGH